jgi:hypothetical protein
MKRDPEQEYRESESRLSSPEEDCACDGQFKGDGPPRGGGGHKRVGEHVETQREFAWPRVESLVLDPVPEGCSFHRLRGAERHQGHGCRY